jgi:hypothetical protein
VRTPRTSRLAVLAVLAALLAVLAAGCSAPTTEPSAQPSAAPRLPPGAEELQAKADRDTEPAVELEQAAAGLRESTPSALEAVTAREPAAGAGLPTPLVDPAELRDGGPAPDGIPPLDEPRFQRTGDVHWVDDAEQVLAVEVGGEWRAYPVQVLTLHEIVNDTVGGRPVAVTYCPLCASGIVFDRKVGARVLSFGTSGLLYRSDLVMYDRQTESLWPQIEGTAVAGTLTGTELEVLPAGLVSWQQWREAHPQAWVLSRQTGFAMAYGANPYVGYDDKQSLPMFFDGPVDNRIEWLKQPVVGIRIGDDALAVDIEALREDGVRQVEVGGRALSVWWLPGARSSLDEQLVGDGREVGTTAVFDPVLDGRALTFAPDGDGIVDVETASSWNALGTAVDGPLAGSQLTPVASVSTFWFAWRSFHLDTRVLR